MISCFRSNEPPWAAKQYQDWLRIKFPLSSCQFYSRLIGSFYSLRLAQNKGGMLRTVVISWPSDERRDPVYLLQREVKQFNQDKIEEFATANDTYKFYVVL